MIEYDLAGTDLGGVRFAISPLAEAALSLRTFRDPGRYPLMLPWLRRTEAARAALDTAMLRALTNDSFWVLDFLTPHPFSPLSRFEDELATAMRTPADAVHADIAEVHPDPVTRPGVLRGPADRVLGRIEAALADYWQTCFVPFWPRMRALLEADIVHQARTIASRGLHGMFAGLAPTVRLDGQIVQVSTSSGARYRRTTAGAGLTLAPSMFVRSASAPISPHESPLLMYAARGLGALFESERPQTPDALAGLVGRARARLLVLLAAPASSTELAVRLGVTTTAVNQHLRALRAAGLLTSARHGRSVLYLRSELGDLLVGEPAGGAAGR
ncbi:ArsR/SmtB family transcription factor [Nocardioides panaciterrulae]|uniref:DNA-binding transcriptional ArsR family regulator n=1 Tax=Nocardioides panaciterrulae TaxID=661492 RepID=A0A7Y9E819_9ACTN|nr:ArsR family transcriptional regulator [Nocardioides panaciterrulae]NYD42943.1 DNA-binding transcriptional ArsR family regulator [Nocardioides panaciterrulae]